MKVALVSRAAHPLHDPGGLERAVYLQAKHLRARGVDTVLVTRPATREGGFPGRVVTVPYRTRRGLAHGTVLDRTLHYPAFALHAGRAVAEMVRAGEVDVVDAQGLSALGYGRLRRDDPTLRAPLVMNPQGMEEHHSRGLKRLVLLRLRRLSREAARLADRVVATDAATRAEVPRRLGVDPARVVVLPNGIDPEEIRALTPSDPAAAVAAAWPEIASASPLMLSVGRIEGYKGFSDVLAALGELHGRRALGERWAWVVVGRGRDEAALRRRVLDLGLRHVHLVGSVPDTLLHALYARADVFVHATRYEGSSLVTLEAMAHGRVVVATRAGGIPDKIEDGVSGRLVRPGDVGALAAAVADVLADEGRRRSMGEAARRRALEAFAWPSLVERTIALYEELLRERRP